MKILAPISSQMKSCLNGTYRLLFLILVIACVSCDSDEKLESSTARFTGTIMNANFSPSPNTKFQILVRTNPTFTTDTTIAVRIPVTTSISGRYDITVHTDGFPAIPFYTVAPMADTLISLEIVNCISQTTYQQILSNTESQMNARFGAATFVKVSFVKEEQSSAISARYLSCDLSPTTTISNPDLTFVHKLPFDHLGGQYTFSYLISYSDFSAETRLTQVAVLPYDTTEVVLTY